MVICRPCVELWEGNVAVAAKEARATAKELRLPKCQADGFLIKMEFMKSSQPCSAHRLLLFFWGWLLLAAVCKGQTVYNFGNPSAEEQLYIEYINRARANPVAESVRMATTTDSDVLSAYTQFGVDLTMMQSEFSVLGAAAPVAPNANLTTSARGHSAWMLANATQSHDETNPANTVQSRIAATGYSISTVGENIFAYVKNVWFGHAGFEVDWGTGGTGGMLAGRGHRMNIHNAAFHEVGVGVVFGSNGATGPQLVTQDFGTSTANPTLGTGVAYYDLNGNNFYDVGEGIAGLTVTVSGASFSCTTATGGGWAVPLPSSAATRTVTFSGLNINQTVNLVVPASTNAKADLRLNYVPPQITSSATAAADSPYTLSFNPVGGATSYTWNRWSLAAAVAENCEDLSNITTATTGTYSVLNTNVKQQGLAAFHLENSTGAIQSLQLNSLYYGQTSPSLSFQSRIRYATTSEQFKVQVKEEGSLVWQDVFTQTGTNSSGETGFSLRSAALSGMTGKAFRVRFLLNFAGGSYYTSSGDIVGWFIDAINFSGMATLANNVSQSLSGTGATFSPSAGIYLMSLAPVISGRGFPPSYLTLISPPPSTYAAWAANIEVANGLAAGTIGNHPDADFDHDGRSNFIEYAFGTSPLIANDPAPRMPVASFTPINFILRYQCDTTLTDITITAQALSPIGKWLAPGDNTAPIGFTDTVIAINGAFQTHEVRLPRASGGNGLMRLQITRH